MEGGTFSSSFPVVKDSIVLAQYILDGLLMDGRVLIISMKAVKERNSY